MSVRPASAVSRKSMVGLARGRASPVVGDNGSETVATGADPGAIRRVVAGPSDLALLAFHAGMMPRAASL